MLDAFGDAARPAGNRRLVARVAESQRAATHVEQPCECGDEERFRVVAADFGVREPEERAGVARAPQGDADRKSTRLKSSHGYISYAVFCLKKKKDTKNY